MLFVSSFLNCAVFREHVLEIKLLLTVNIVVMHACNAVYSQQQGNTEAAIAGEMLYQTIVNHHAGGNYSEMCLEGSFK